MKNTSTGGDFCCDFGWQKGAATTESSHLLQPTNVPNIPLKSFVFQPIDPPSSAAAKTRRKRGEKAAGNIPNHPIFFDNFVAVSIPGLERSKNLTEPPI
uniref:Uncharacterized protein n=1 Tax=Lactuca sativa TaxID=4236 RepID=A0A9R1UHJ1_LACSA|nr:hypothetical protein LSAT_V11C900499540 [Lactuca sativa]